jgi:hypothetical protein
LIFLSLARRTAWLWLSVAFTTLSKNLVLGLGFLLIGCFQ